MGRCGRRSSPVADERIYVTIAVTITRLSSSVTRRRATACLLSGAKWRRACRRRLRHEGGFLSRGQDFGVRDIPSRDDVGASRACPGSRGDNPGQHRFAPPPPALSLSPTATQGRRPYSPSATILPGAPSFGGPIPPYPIPLLPSPLPALPWVPVVTATGQAAFETAIGLTATATASSDSVASPSPSPSPSTPPVPSPRGDEP